jgi:DNA-binding CsgD family transcriptional regulator
MSGAATSRTAAYHRRVTEDGGSTVEELVAGGGLAYADDRLDDTRAAWEAAYVAAKAAGDTHAAARLAINLLDLHASILGNTAAGNGWRARAVRLLGEAGHCVEQGHYELAVIACDRPDVDELAASADRARAIGEEFGDTGLVVRALAEGGLALVSQGRTAEGFARLDEALASICAGEVGDDLSAIGRSFCAMLTACERADDVARAEEWIRLVDEMVLRPLDGRPRILHTHCRAAYGAVLCEAGRWDEAEAAMMTVLGPEGSRSLLHRVDTIARLARLRVAQGRLEDAAALLAPHEDRLSVWLPLAEVHLRRGDADVAVALARRALDRLIGDVTRRAPLLALLVEAELVRGDVDAAMAAATELDEAATRIGTPVAAAGAAIARVHIAAARGGLDDAIAEARRAGALLGESDAPFLLVTSHRLAAEALAERGDSADAVAEARAALAVAQRLGAAAECDRLTALLRRLGVAARPATEAAVQQRLAGLTARESQVLERLGHGATNAEIGEQLFISAKTVEHHVSRILAKLGVRTRAEAAAVAAAAPVGAGSE